MLATQDILLEAAQPLRLTEVVPDWLRSIPLYRDRSDSPAQPGLDSARLANLPLITKADIRANFPANFLGPDADLEGMVEDELIELEHTSGTSEQHRTPLLLPYGWWQQQEERALRLNPFLDGLLDAQPNPRRVTISSPVCNGEICFTGVPPKSERIVGNSLFASLSRFPFLWSEADLERIARETLEWAPVFLDVDPVYGLVFARYCERHGIRLPSLRFVLCSYEFLSRNHRRILERAFGVPVVNLYGSTETGHLLMETEPGVMKPSLQTAFLEVIHPDAGGIGDLIVTTLSNPFMPLIRYRIGDLVETTPGPYRTVYVVHGRALDALRTPSGRRVTVRQVDECFEGLDGFAHYQLSGGRERGAWLLRYVPDLAGPTPEGMSALQERLGGLVEAGGCITCEPVDTLMPENSGKFRLVYPPSS